MSFEITSLATLGGHDLLLTRSGLEHITMTAKVADVRRLPLLPSLPILMAVVGGLAAFVALWNLQGMEKGYDFCGCTSPEHRWSVWENGTTNMKVGLGFCPYPALVSGDLCTWCAAGHPRIR